MPPSNAARSVQRREILDRKLALGHTGLRALIGWKLWLSEKITRFAVARSGPARRFSVCLIEVPTGSASDFVSWFVGRNDLNDEPPMIDGHPDHYIIARDHEGRQLVAETTGGSPLPGEFIVDYEDLSSLRSVSDPAFEYQVAGVARLHDGLAIGGVRHQFSQVGDGFVALLTVEFPKHVPAKMVREHQWHLAIEFSNWIDAAQANGS